MKGMTGRLWYLWRFAPDMMALSGALPLATSSLPSPGATQPPNAMASGSVEPIAPPVEREGPTAQYLLSYSVLMKCVRLIKPRAEPGREGR
eukprot:scaffold281436_cov24-Tisochrysis_lutea.AAC.1